MGLFFDFFCRRASRGDQISGVALGADGGDCAPCWWCRGCRAGTPATMITRWPGADEGRRGNAIWPARLTMSSWSRRIFGHHAMHAPDHPRAGRPAVMFGRDRHDRRLRPLARHAAPRSSPSWSSRSKRAGRASSAICRAASAMASPAVDSGAGRCAMMTSPINRVALHFFANTVHGRDCLDRGICRLPISRRQP